MSGALYVIALYRFESLPEPAVFCETIREVAKSRGVRGTLIIAAEGLNGTLAGTREDLEAVLASCDGFIKLDPPRFDPVAEWPFARLFVHLKKEIVTMGVDAIDPNLQRGCYVDPRDWNQLIADPDIVVVDTRNDFEVRLGTFARAENPSTNAFTEFPHWADKNAERLKAAKGVAMFCTGGIRCEKATSYLKTIGVRDTFHLRGGILRYLNAVPEEESYFTGDCFVFDDRVAVGLNLEVNANVGICYGCRHALTESMRADKRYEPGVSCPDCYDRTTTEQKAKYRARHEQFIRARQTDGDT